MVFSLQNQLRLQAFNEPLPSTFVYGQLEAFKDIQVPPNSTLIVAVFQPSGLSSLLRTPAHDLRGEIVSLDSILGKPVLAIEERLQDSTAIYEQLSLLNHFFLSMLPRRIKSTVNLAGQTTAFIQQRKGLITVKELIGFTGYCERQIARIFLDTIGISPKNYAKLIKLQHFIKELQSAKNTTKLSELAYQSGYADQSHLNKDFKTITGMTPGNYKVNQEKLAINFL